MSNMHEVQSTYIYSASAGTPGEVLSFIWTLQSLLRCCDRWRVERYMQGVFALSAAAMFVPVIFHTTRVTETDSLNKDAPGMTRWG